MLSKVLDLGSCNNNRELPGMCPNFVFQNHSTYVSIGAVDLGKKIPGLGSALSLFALSLKIAHCKEQLE